MEENENFQKDVKNVVENQVNENENQVNQNEPNKKKNGKGKTIALMIIVLILVVVIGVLAGLFISGNGDKVTNIINQGTNKEENKSSKKIDENKAWVYDADYMKDKEDKVKTSIYNPAAFKASEEIRLPYININSDDAKKANEEIKKMFDEAYNDFGKALEITDYATGKKSYDKDSFTYTGYSYVFYENNNILSIVISKIETCVPGDGGPSYITYNFDLETLKQVKITDVLQSYGFDSKSDLNSKMIAKIKSMSSQGEAVAEDVSTWDGTRFFIKDNKINVFVPGLAYGEHIVEVDSSIETSSNNNEKTEESKQENTTSTINQTENIDYSVFSKFKGRKFRNQDFNTRANTAKEYCEVTIDSEGKPTIKIGYKSDVNSECYFETKKITSLETDAAAGTIYATLKYTAWTAGGDKTGSAVVSYSNVSDNYILTVSATLDGGEEYNNIDVKVVGQNSVDEFKIDSLANRVYESEKRENSRWYKIEFDSTGKPTIFVYGYTNGTSQIDDTYKRFTDVSIDNAAGSAYVTFSYRLLNETGNKVEGTLRYSNNTDNNEIGLRLNNRDQSANEISLKRVK